MTDAAIRGERARQLLEDTLLVEALDAIERDAVDSLAAARLSDGQALIEHAGRLQAVRLFRQELQSVVTTGRLAEHRS